MNNEKNRLDIIHRIPIPMNVLKLVKDYLFHTETTSPIMSHIRTIKREICDLIMNHSIVTRRDGHYPGTDHLRCEDWFFTISMTTANLHPSIFADLDDYWPLSIEYEFGARNCNACGDYNAIQSHDMNSRGLTSRNTCKCIK